MNPDEEEKAAVDPVGATAVHDPSADVALSATAPGDSGERPRSDDAEALGPFGPFTRVERLAEQGAMGTVARGYHEGFDRWELLKFLRADLMHQPELVRQFFREGQVLAKLSHPNVVQVFALYAYGGRPCLAMEFLEGQSLAALVTDSGRLPMARWHDLFLAAARGLAAAHEVGLLHRDIKPENLFVAKDRPGAPGGLKLIDFGLATADRSRRDLPEGSARLVSRNSGGTPLYMAPELWNGEEASPRSDLYALGLSFFVALTGRLPFEPPETVTEACLRICAPEPFPDARELRPDLPAVLALALARTLAKSKDERFASADELVAALVAAASAARPRRVPGSGPYRGLSSYGATERDVFFGRDAEITEVLERLRWQPGVVLVGPSGSGKSSLAQAGVLPGIEEGALGGGITFSAVVLAPRAHPIHSMAAALARTLGVGEREVVAFLRARPASLGEALRAALPGTAGVVVLVDQLEELATVAVDPGEVHDFGVALGSLVEVASAGIKVLVTLRADRMDGLFALEPLRPLLTRGFCPVRPLAGEALRRAIVEPALAAGYKLEDPGLADQMCSEVARQGGGLPLLSFAMATWWEARDERTHTLPTAAWVALGGLAGALTRHGDRVLEAMSDEELRAAEQILVRLVSSDRTRIPVARASLLDPAAAGPGAARALGRLLESKLVNESGGDIELAHDTLIAQWPRLRSLLLSSGEDRAFHERVSAAARDWEAQRRPDGALWSGDQAMRLRRWFASTNAPLDQQELAFVEAVIRRARRARLGLRSGIVALVLAALAVGLVAKASERAMRQRLETTTAQLADSRRAYARAEAGRLKGQAMDLLEADPAAALGRAAASYELEHDPGLDRIAWAARARGVAVVLPPLGSPVRLVRVGAGEGWIAAASDTRISVLASHSREHASIRASPDPGAVVSALAFSPDGTRLAIGTSAGDISVAQAPAFAVHALARCGGSVHQLQWSESTSLRVSCVPASGVAQALVVDVATADTHPGAPPDDPALGPSGARVSIGVDRVARVRAQGGEWSFEARSPAFAWLESRDAVALVGGSGHVLIVSLATGELLGDLATSGHDVTSLDADGAGEWLIAGASDGALLAFDLEPATAALTQGPSRIQPAMCGLSGDGAAVACSEGGEATMRTVARSTGARRPPKPVALKSGGAPDALAVAPAGASLFALSHDAVSRDDQPPVRLLQTADDLAASESYLAVAGQSAPGQPALVVAPVGLSSQATSLSLPARITSLAWTADGSRLLVATADRKVLRIDPGAPAAGDVVSLEETLAAGDTVGALSASDDGKVIAMGTNAGWVLIAAPESPVRPLVRLRAPVACISVARSARAIVAGVERQPVVIATDSGVAFPLWKAAAPIAACARSPFEDRFSFVDTDGTTWLEALDLAGVVESYVPPDAAVPGSMPTLAAWQGLPHGLGR